MRTRPIARESPFFQFCFRFPLCLIIIWLNAKTQLHFSFSFSKWNVAKVSLWYFIRLFLSIFYFFFLYFSFCDMFALWRAKRMKISLSCSWGHKKCRAKYLFRLWARARQEWGPAQIYAPQIAFENWKCVCCSRIFILIDSTEKKTHTQKQTEKYLRAQF